MLPILARNYLDLTFLLALTGVLVRVGLTKLTDLSSSKCEI